MAPVSPLQIFPSLSVLLTRTLTSSLVQSNGNDIVFTASDGTTKLSHEIESFTQGTGTLVAWVNVPSLPNSTNTTIYMYYGNLTVSNQQNATGSGIRTTMPYGTYRRIPQEPLPRNWTVHPTSILQQTVGEI